MSASASPQLSVISRHSGSPDSQTSAVALHSYITTTLLPRVMPLLNRFKAEARVRQQERELRAEQDRAFAEAERIDRERMAKRQEEESRLRKEEEERKNAEVEQQVKEHWRRQWRLKAKATFTTEPGPENPGRLRIGIRLPNGQLQVRYFRPTDNVERLFTFVDIQFLTPESPDADAGPPLPADYQPDFHFTLATLFPRAEIRFSYETRLGDIGALKGGANLAVEMKETERKGTNEDRDDVDSGEDN